MGLCRSSAGRQREAGKRDGVEAVHRNNDEARHDTRQERFLSHSFVPFSSLRTSFSERKRANASKVHLDDCGSEDADFSIGSTGVYSLH